MFLINQLRLLITIPCEGIGQEGIELMSIYKTKETGLQEIEKVLLNQFGLHTLHFKL